MAGTMQKFATGHIIAVQEQRFRLVNQTGQVLLLTLANHAKQSDADLHRWQEEGAVVTVAYTGEPNLDSGVAHSVKPAV
jgi:hypothetical protein